MIYTGKKYLKVNKQQNKLTNNNSEYNCVLLQEEKVN